MGTIELKVDLPTGLSGDEAKVLLAIKLYEIGKASLGQAAKIAGCSKRAFMDTLGQYQVHAGISIPTFNNKSKVELQEGWHVAIEPFITNGDGFVKERGTSTIWMMRKGANARSPYAK